MPPASAFVQVSRFIDPRWLAEVEADAIVARVSTPSLQLLPVVGRQIEELGDFPI